MDKTLQDHVWKHCLPKEFNEEVKKEYEHQLSIDNEQAYWMLERIFSKHNLTSDAEEEDEVLTVSRKEVQERYAANERLKEDFPKSDIYLASNSINVMLEDLFGSKCLPDEPASEVVHEDNFTNKEPKFHKGDKVKVITNVWNNIFTVLDIKEEAGGFSYRLSCSPDSWYSESTLTLAKEPKPAESSETLCMDSEGFYRKGTDEHCNKVKVRIPSGETGPYTEPREDHIGENHEMVDNILKNGFREHNRLHIAAMAMQGILSNQQLLKIAIETYQEEIGSPDMFVAVAKAAKAQADVLIAESEKGGLK